MLWDEIVKDSTRQQIDSKQKVREELQKTILTFLSQKAYFNTLVFQGGTALRLCYDNPRFSEDLDFVSNDTEKPLQINWSPLKRFILDMFPFLTVATIKEQKSTDQLSRYILRTKGSLAAQNSRIHIEIVSIPSYDHHPSILSYPPFNPAIQVESKQEILADKITALGLRPYIKGRDLWDIYFLIGEKNTQISWELVGKKINDYNVTEHQYMASMNKRTANLEQLGTPLLSFELKRFLPQPLFDHYEPQFSMILQTVHETLSDNPFK